MTALRLEIEKIDSIFDRFVFIATSNNKRAATLFPIARSDLVAPMKNYVIA